MSIRSLLGLKPTQSEFAQLYVKAALAAGMEGPLRINDDEFSVSYGESGAGVAYLQNAYGDYCKAPRGERGGVLRRYIAGMMEKPIPTSFAVAKTNLMPIVRGRVMHEIQRLTAKSMGLPAAPDAPSEVFSDDGIVMIAYDTEQSIRVIRQEELETWGVSFEVALEAALDNLRDRTTDQFAEIAPGVMCGAWEDSYDTSRVLLSDAIHRANVPDPVLMIPTRASLLIASARNEQSLLKMVEVAEASFESDGRPISSLMYHFVEGKLTSYNPSSADVSRKLANLSRLYLASDYDWQKNVIEKIHEKDGTDIFLASYTLLQGKSGDSVSFCSWASGVDSSLPVTDLVAFSYANEGEKETAVKFARWEDVRATFHQILEREEYFPARFRAATFPDRAAIESLPDAHP